MIEVLAQTTRAAGGHGHAFWVALLSPIAAAIGAGIRHWLPILMQKWFGVTDPKSSTKDTKSTKE